MGAEQADRRAHPRRKVLLNAEIFPISGYTGIKIIGASATGFMGVTTASLRPSHPLLFSVDQKHFHEGTVRWVKGDRVGVELNDALNILGKSLEDPGAALRQSERSGCQPVALDGRIATGSTFHRATALDVSQSGMRLQLKTMPEIGQRLLVRLNNRPLIMATVRWRAEQMIGIETAERMSTLRLAYGDE
ncbi:MAG: PilZ domain-containing protein [Rhizorhabdus sp.]